MSASGSLRSRHGFSRRVRVVMAGLLAAVTASTAAVGPVAATEEPPTTPSTWAPAADETTVPPTTAPSTTQATTTEAPTTTTSVSTTEASTSTTTGPSTTTPSSTSPSTTADGAGESSTTSPDGATTTETSAPDDSTTSIPEGCPVPGEEDGSDPTTPATSAPVTTDGEITFTTNEAGEPVIVDGCTVVTIDPDDPAAFEEPAESVPETDATVPPRSRGAYANQPDFVPNAVVYSNVRDARAKLDAALVEHVEAVATVKSLRLRLKELRQDQRALSGETQALLEDLRAAEVRLEIRATQAFVRGDSLSLVSGFDQDALLEAQVQQEMMEAVLDQDREAIENFATLRASLTNDDLLLYDRIRVVERSINAATDRVDDRSGAIEQAEVELEAFEAGSDVFIQNLHYPIAWPYDVPLIDSYGFPRATGTADEHWHEGIDLFAPYGTPLLAVERGVITRIGNGRLGGLTFWLRGESGTDWYYAHLSSFAPDLAVGQVVEAGDIVGAVGTSGNAVGTPPHLHMQMHPDGGRPLNPYPILAVRVEKDAELRAQEALRSDEAPSPSPGTTRAE